MTSPIKILVCINGGALQSVYVPEGVEAEIELFDMDDKEAEGKFSSEIDDEWDEATDGMRAVY